MFYSPLRYPGGKTSLCGFMKNLFYGNDLIGIEYAEPYAGGAGLALMLLFEGYVSHIHINDLDRAVYAFWSEILRDPNDFCNWVENVQITIVNWLNYREILKESDTANLADLARAFFFLNRTNVSGIIKGGVIGGYLQNGKYKMDARFNRTDLANRIRRISQISNKITVSNLDGVLFIDRLASLTNEVFIYLDPPYVKKGSELYMNYYKKDDHTRLSTKIRTSKNPWIVSYDNNELIIGLYDKERKINYQIAQSTSNRVGDEILIFSESLDFAKSLPSLKNPTYINTMNG